MICNLNGAATTAGSLFAGCAECSYASRANKVSARRQQGLAFATIDKVHESILKNFVRVKQQEAKEKMPCKLARRRKKTQSGACGPVSPALYGKELLCAQAAS